MAEPIQGVQELAGVDPLAVLPGQRRDNVDVIVGVPARDPPHRFVITRRRQADPMDALPDDVDPMPVSRVPIILGGMRRCTGSTRRHWSRPRPAANSAGFSAAASIPRSQPPPG